jgi:hypothetical protein
LTLREFVAAHCGLNPNVAAPLDPSAKLAAEVARLQAKVADLQEKLIAANQAKIAAQALLKENKAEQKAARKPDTTQAKPTQSSAKPRRNEYMRELMRRKRAETKAKQAPQAAPIPAEPIAPDQKAAPRT